MLHVQPKLQKSGGSLIENLLARAILSFIMFNEIKEFYILRTNVLHLGATMIFGNTIKDIRNEEMWKK